MEIGSAEVGHSQVRATEVRHSEISLSQISQSQIRTTEVCHGEIGSTKINTGEIKLVEDSFTQIKHYLWMFLSPLVPVYYSLFKKVDMFLLRHFFCLLALSQSLSF